MWVALAAITLTAAIGFNVLALAIQQTPIKPNVAQCCSVTTGMYLVYEFMHGGWRRVEDFSPAFELIKAKADALYVAIDQLMVANLMRSLRLRLARGFQRSSAPATLSAAGASCPTDQVTRNGSGARQITWIKFCAGRSLAIYQSSSRGSLSLSSI
jgi:hypothetical protein